MQSSIAFERIDGTGTPVVLIHGIGHRRQAWGQLPQMIAARGHDVITVDLPGHGESPKAQRPDTYSVGSIAEQLERLFADLGLERPHVVGNSLGGLFSLELGRRGSVSSVTALSPAGFYPPWHLLNVGANLLFMKFGSYMPEAFHRKMAEYTWFKKLAFRSLYTHPEKVTVEEAVGDTLNLRRAKGFWPFFFRAIFWRFVKDSTVPTTIGWGDHDRLLLPSEAKYAAERLPSATIVSLPDCGHCPQIDHPELCVDLVAETIARADARALPA